MGQFNFRLFLRPTAVGRIIIDRLTSDGADRQAEARRWIELGYMCEQAGMRLDGSTLVQAGRPAAAEHLTPAPVAIQSTPIAAQSAAVAVSRPVQQAAPSAPASAQSRPSANISPGLPHSPLATPQPVTPGDASPTMDSQLSSNLRNLAH